MRAVDTNVLIFAEITSSRHHDRARALLEELAEGGRPWAIPWPCIYEFLRVVTHPRVFHPPMPLERALADITSVLSSPALRLLQETSRHPGIMTSVLRESAASGNLIHDAHIAALCIEHGVSDSLRETGTSRRFSLLNVVDPFHA